MRTSPTGNGADVLQWHSPKQSPTGGSTPCGMSSDVPRGLHSLWFICQSYSESQCERRCLDMGFPLWGSAHEIKSWSLLLKALVLVIYVCKAWTLMLQEGKGGWKVNSSNTSKVKTGKDLDMKAGLGETLSCLRESLMHKGWTESAHSSLTHLADAKAKSKAVLKDSSFREILPGGSKRILRQCLQHHGEVPLRNSSPDDWQIATGTFHKYAD